MDFTFGAELLHLSNCTYGRQIQTQPTCFLIYTSTIIWDPPKELPTPCLSPKRKKEWCCPLVLGLAPTIILYLALVTSTSFLEIWEPPKMTNVSSTCTIVGIILHRISTQYASIKSKFVRRGVHLPLTFSGLPCSQSGQWFTPEKINL